MYEKLYGYFNILNIYLVHISEFQDLVISTYK